MRKLYSEIIGKPVFSEYSASSIALVRDMIIDPENGRVMAFVVGKKSIIVPMDVTKFADGLFVSNQDCILPVEDVLRVKELEKLHIPIIGERVITERRKTYLGRVVNYEIDAKLMVLAKLYVAKTFFFFHFQDKIISYPNIVRISKNFVVVRDSNEVPVREKAAVRPEAYAA